MEMKAGMKYETEIVVNEGMLANHNDPQLPAIELPFTTSVISTSQRTFLPHGVEARCLTSTDIPTEPLPSSRQLSINLAHVSSIRLIMLGVEKTAGNSIAGSCECV